MQNPPKTFTPKPYQDAASHFLLQEVRAALFVEPGLGKTIITLNALHTLIQCGFEHQVLIVAPLRVARDTWINEVKKWQHTQSLTITAIVGTPKERLAALNSDAQIKTINYENLSWLADTLGEKWPFRIVVFDESSKLKSFRAHFRRNASGVETLYRTGGTRAGAIVKQCFKKTQYVWLLTGTPSANSLAALWPQLFFIDAGERLGKSFSSFEERWFKINEYNRSREPFPHSEEQIRNLIADKCFTLRAKDYLELGEEITNTIYVDLPETAMQHYRSMEKEFYVKIKEREIEAFSAATRSAKLHQLANGGIYYDKKGSWEHAHDAKLEALDSIVEEACGMPVLVVYEFKSDLERLQKHYPKGKALDSKSKATDNFLKGEVPVAFIHPDSIGYGVDGLHYVTNTIVFFALDWDNEMRIQVIARVGAVRQAQAGFKRPTIIHQIVARDTIDEIILERIETKVSIEEALKQGLARRYGV